MPSSRLVGGPRVWRLRRDEEGHREYRVTHLVEMDSKFDGPALALQAPGLPRPGAFWSFGNDKDLWAWCLWTADVEPHEVPEGEPVQFFAVEQVFSSRPPGRCQDFKVDDPLLEPAKISGSFVREKEEATHDRHGDPILTSSLEMIRGSQVEFDTARPTVRIERNVARLNLGQLASMINTVNARPLWGLGPRRVKLANASWEQKFHGRCYRYFTLVLEFEVNFKTFDRDVLDEGTKVLRGEWNNDTGNWDLVQAGGRDPDPLNPRDFIRFVDRNNNPCRVVLDGRGLPAGAATVSRRLPDCPAFGPAVPEAWVLNVTPRPTVGLAGVLQLCQHCDEFGGNFTLEHTAGCVWDGETFDQLGIHNCGWGGAAHWHLYVDQFSNELRLEIFGSTARWSLDLDLADPLGPNNLALDTADPACDWPFFVTVTPKVVTTAVRSIHVEKYEESNFLLLGVPAVLR